MVEMIPDQISTDIKSQAEVKLFNDFRSASIPGKVKILHSLALSEHVKNTFGEIDFVIVCNRGVLCIEVKGGAVTCNKGIWEFTNRYGKTSYKPEGPFQQVLGNMYSLRSYLVKRLGATDPLVRCQFANCVIMPDCDFQYDGPEITQEILFDKCSYRDLNGIISHSFDYWSDVCYEKHGFRGGELNDDEIKRMVSLLRGDFCFVPSMKDSISETVKELCALTDEQYEILEALSDNERTMVSGVAGSGKTLLAMEQARRSFWEGKHVLYLCFNNNIAEYVAYQFEKENIGVDASTLHSFMMHICGDIGVQEKDTNYFNKVLPEQFINMPDVPSYDLLIIDEGQDLLRGDYLLCINKLIKGGIDKGNWLIFYDPNQNIYGDSNSLKQSLEYLKGLSASYKLTINCRNTKQIADTNSLISGIPNIGRTKVSGQKVKYFSYHDKEEEFAILKDVVITLQNEGIAGGDYIILSKYSLNNENNVLYKRSIGKLKYFGQMWRAKNSEIRFSTIASFKGMESKIVIIIDLDDFWDKDCRYLNYVGISRACAALYVIYDAKCENDRQQMIGMNFQKLL